jgi:hypothetical protein
VKFYGTVESIDDSSVVVKTTKHSTDHGKIDADTKTIGSIKVGDWVFLEVKSSGHVKTLKLEERPAGRAGVIKEIHGIVLTVHSANRIEKWNLVETTLLDDVARGDLSPGDEIGAKLYKNHNLAELRVIKHGVH